jgi:hypothetical protein
MIHFGAARVDGILGCMGLLIDFLSQPLVTWNDYSVFKP